MTALAMQPVTRSDRRSDIAPSDRATRLYAWMGMQWRVPRAWEILGHACSEQRGRVILADRRRQRMQVSWLQVDSKPDIQRALSDYAATDKEDDESCRHDPVHDYQRWKGHVLQGEDGVLTRLSRYVTDRKLWVEIALDWRVHRDVEAERRIIDSFELLPYPWEGDGDADSDAAATKEVGDEPVVRWRAFGLDVLTPRGWKLARAEVKPAEVTLRFEQRERPHLPVLVQRSGMLETWYDGDLKPLLRHRVGYGPDIAFDECSWASHDALRARSDVPIARGKKLLGQGRKRCDVAWIDEVAHAAISITTWSTRRQEIEPERFKVAGVDVT